MTGWMGSQDVGRKFAERFNDLMVLERKIHLRRRVPLIVALLAALAVMAAAALVEMRTSWLQSLVFSGWARSMSYHLESGPSDAIHFPAYGPFDKERGYVALPHMLQRLTDKGFRIERQARQSPALASFQKLGGFPPYHEKAVTGLTIIDSNKRPYFAARYPKNAYGNYADVPPLVRNSLLFIENRELMDRRYPLHNPAIEWDRLWLAMFRFGASEATGGSRPGGSTLATQIEKFRHSEGGRTSGARDKLRQMMSASVRAYDDGPDTQAARNRIVLAALNSMPLAAYPRHGEVIGLGDGLRLWYGADFQRVNSLLSSGSGDPSLMKEKALAFRQVLSLVIAQRRPSWYLRNGEQDLATLTDSHIRLMAQAGLIDSGLRDAALAAQPVVRKFAAAPADDETDGLGLAKSASVSRIGLLGLLGTPSLYDLDRMDLTAETTLDTEAQSQVTALLRSLNEPETLAELGLVGKRLLQGNQGGKVAYSFTLFERGDKANLLRIQTDSLDKPLDLNTGSKMELGSTAKVRTLLTYLDIIAGLYDRMHSLPADQLQANIDNGDPLTAWVAGELADNGDNGLDAMLHAAMARTYSASPYERFFTAGGSHVFVNFDRKFNGQHLTVTKGLEQSVNLVFIRMMRDIVNYQIAQLPGRAGILTNPDHPMRRVYLARFADMEGRQYLWRFYPAYRGLTRDAIMARIADRSKYLKPRLAASFRTVRPQASFEEFSAFINRFAAQKPDGEEAMRKLYDTYATDRLNLADRSYIATIHPLELWLAGYLYAHPGADWDEITQASTGVRQESYQWLMRPNRFAAQNRRIRTLLEQEAFVPIHQQWQRLGYPFGHLVPSYATAIGTSGDRPDALAKLMGIIVNHGVALPTVRVSRLRFAQNTPYESWVAADPAAGKQVLRPEIADIARAALINVVENGTARRARGALDGPGEQHLVIGAKTGTGDNRTQQFGRGGRIIGSQVRSRTATLMFFIGNRFFGTITAHVDGPDAAAYRFTSALPAQLFKSIAPIIQPIIDRSAKARPLTVAETMVPPVDDEVAAAPLPVRRAAAGPALPSR